MTIENLADLAGRHTFNQTPHNVQDVMGLLPHEVQEAMTRLSETVAMDQYGNATRSGDLARFGLDIDLTHSMNEASEGGIALSATERSGLRRAKRSIERISDRTVRETRNFNNAWSRAMRDARQQLTQLQRDGTDAVRNAAAGIDVTMNKAAWDAVDTTTLPRLEINGRTIEIADEVSATSFVRRNATTGNVEIVAATAQDARRLMENEGRQAVTTMMSERSQYLSEVQRAMGEHLGEYRKFVDEAKNEAVGKANELLKEGEKAAGSAAPHSENKAMQEMEHAVEKPKGGFFLPVAAGAAVGAFIGSRMDEEDSHSKAIMGGVVGAIAGYGAKVWMGAKRAVSEFPQLADKTLPHLHA